MGGACLVYKAPAFTLLAGKELDGAQFISNLALQRPKRELPQWIREVDICEL